jgi:hypothetical protein
VEVHWDCKACALCECIGHVNGTEVFCGATFQAMFFVSYLDSCYDILDVHSKVHL